MLLPFIILMKICHFLKSDKISSRKSKKCIKIPTNCFFVQFQSICNQGDNIIYSLFFNFKNNNILPLYGNLNTCFESITNGFLNELNDYENTTHFISQSTIYIHCNEGDIFYYKGWGTNIAVSCIFFDSNKNIQGFEKINSLTKFTKVIIPNGINYVKFSSCLDDEHLISDKLIFELYSGQDITLIQDIVKDEIKEKNDDNNILTRKKNKLAWRFLCCKPSAIIYTFLGIPYCSKI